MSISGTMENKNSVSANFEAKPSGLTWGDATWTWDEETGTWSAPKLIATKENKNSVSGNFEAKN